MALPPGGLAARGWRLASELPPAGRAREALLGVVADAWETPTLLAGVSPLPPQNGQGPMGQGFGIGQHPVAFFQG